MWQVKRLAAVIELILKYHPKGLRVLVGDVEPTMTELDEILQSVEDNDLPFRIAAAFPSSPQERGLMRAETILSIVDEGGGWAGIAQMARDFRELYSDTWEIFRTHVEWIDNGNSRIEQDSALRRMAVRFGISEDTIQRKRRFVIEKIAIAAIRTDRVLTA